MERVVVWHRTLPPLFEGADYNASATQWVRYVIRSLEDAEGEILSAFAGTVVAAFKTQNLREVIETVYRLTSHAEQVRVPEGGMRIAIGVSMGEVELENDIDPNAAMTGSAIDSSQILANLAQAGEIVVDTRSRQATSQTFVFERSINTESIAMRGEVLDRERPFRSDCAQEIGLLQTPNPTNGLYTALSEATIEKKDRSTRLVIVVGPRGSGTYRAYESLRTQANPAVSLKFQGVPGGLEPLGSLRLGLLHRWGSPHAVREALETMDPTTADAFEAVATGDPPPHGIVVEAFVTLCQQACASGRRPWFYMDPLETIDVATLAIVQDALRRPKCYAVLVARSSTKSLPAAFDGLAEPGLVWIPPLSINDATQIAAQMLSLPLDNDLVRNIAGLRGTSMVAVAETIRLLISNADIVHDKQKFRWRRHTFEVDAQNGSRSIIDARVATLQNPAKRLLQIASVATVANGLEVLLTGAILDGTDREQAAAAFEQLRTEQFLSEEGKPLSEPLRRAVLESMSAERSLDVHRMVAAAIRDAEPYGGPALSATVGALLCEGGQLEEGSEALLQSGALAASLGYRHAAFKLAATAVQFNPSKQTRLAAEGIGGSIATAPLPVADTDEIRTEPRPKALNMSQSIVHAIRTADHAHVDRLIEEAITRGCNLVPAECLRAISLIVRGDITMAKRALTLADQGAEASPQHRAKVILTSALLSIANGRLDDAICQTLDALAFSKDTNDNSGIIAAQHMLARVYRDLGRPDIASRLAGV